MAKINSMMDIGKRSMMNSQTALQTTAHNIANKTTDNYSRQRVEIQTAVPVSEGSYQIGMGTRAAAITRVNNPYLEKQTQVEQGKLGFSRGRSEGLQRVEQVFNEQQNKGLNQYVTDFFNAFRELANTPESVTTRTLVKESAEAVAKDFHRVHDQLKEIQKDLDGNIQHQVEEINKMIREVASLNEQVASTEVQGFPANDQRDRRDLLLKQLNEKIDIHFAEGDNGMVSISTAGNAILVSGYNSYELQTQRDLNTDRVQIYYKPNESTPPFNITTRVHGGEIGGALDVRDHVITDMKEKMDWMAYTMAWEVNDAHVQGFDRSGKQGTLFFNMPRNIENASQTINVHEDILGDVNKIAAAAQVGSPGDNRVAHVISQLQYREIMDDNNATMDDFYNSQVGRIGVTTQRAIKTAESQKNIVDQLSTLRESISGVSLDEETAKMIELQKTFDASARVIKTADEMFDTILNLKRL